MDSKETKLKEEAKREREREEYSEWVEDQAYCEYGGDYQD